MLELSKGLGTSDLRRSHLPLENAFFFFWRNIALGIGYTLPTLWNEMFEEHYPDSDGESEDHGSDWIIEDGSLSSIALVTTSKKEIVATMTIFNKS